MFCSRNWFENIDVKMEICKILQDSARFCLRIWFCKILPGNLAKFYKVLHPARFCLKICKILLEDSARFCNVQQCSAMFSKVLPRSAMFINVQQGSATFGNVLQCVVIFCRTFQKIFMKLSHNITNATGPSSENINVKCLMFWMLLSFPETSV